MAPKKSKGPKHANKFLKEKCLRDLGDGCNMNNVGALKKCNSENTLTLWPDYKDDPSNAGLDQLGDEKVCNELLLVAFNNNQNACNLTVDGGLDIDTARNTMAGAKSRATFKQVPITKQMLEYAFQNVKKKKGKSTISTPVPTPESTGDVNKVTSAIQGLHVVNPASPALTQAPSTASNVPSDSGVVAANEGTSSQADIPIISPENPQKESVQAVPEVGVARPPNARPQPHGKVITNYFKVTLVKPKSGSTHVLYEYQITGLLVPPPNDLSRSKKKVMIKRFTQLSPFLNGNNAPFVSNAEGRIIAWRCLDPNTALNNTVGQQNVPDFDRNQHGVVSQYLSMGLEYVRRIDLDDLQRYAGGYQMAYPASIAEEAPNILVGQAVSDSNTGGTFVQIGDNQFFPLAPEHDLRGWGMIGLRGYTSHAKARQGGLYLNVNTALSAFFRKGTVDRFIGLFIPPQGRYPRDFLNRPDARQHLVGLRVRIKYNRDKSGEPASRKDTPEGRLKSITGFSKEFADQIHFVDRSGATVSVWQHFQADHPAEAALSIRKGKQICVNTSSTQTGRECWFLPDQLDVVPGQIYRKTLDRLDAGLTATMIQLSCQRPVDNQQDIANRGMHALGLRHGQPDPARLVDAGIKVDKQMIDVPFRQIQSPAVTYAGPRNVAFSAPGQWRTRGMKFWSQNRQHFQRTEGVAFFCPTNGLSQQQYGAAYIAGFQQTWQMNYNQAQQIQIGQVWQRFPAPGLNNLGSVTQTMQNSKAGLVVLALPAANAQVRPLYANFRIAMDQVVGKPSLVVCETSILGSLRNFQVGNPMNGATLIPYWAGNALKINGRLGNVNHIVGGYQALSPKSVCDTLVLGADLIHPKATSSESCPTIACIAASIDGEFAKFVGSARRQTARVEIIDNNNMISMVTEALMNWQRINSKRLPARVLYYRDGTGDSQYAGMLREVSAIKTAWQNVAGPQRSTEVAVTAVVAVKRHTTRFYPVRKGQEFSTRTGNIFPGSVINSLITSPYYFDFYLQSHDVEKGSAKATLYRVLENGMNFSEQALQDITNAFCYNFSHSTTAVSYASPAYYADRLCERCMLYLQEFFDNNQRVQNLPNNAAARDAQVDVAWNRGQQGVNRNPWHKNFNDKMFWM